MICDADKRERFQMSFIGLGLRASVGGVSNGEISMNSYRVQTVLDLYIYATNPVEACRKGQETLS